MLHAAFLRSPHAHARIRVDRCRGGARARPAWSPSIPRQTSATTGSRGRCWCRRRRSRAWSSTSARRCRSPRTRCATSASRWRWWSRRAATSPRTRSATSSSTRAAAGGRSISRPRSRRTRRACTTISTRNVAAARRPGQGRLRRRARAAPTRHRAPLPLRPRRLGADRDPRRRRAVGRAGRTADDLGHDPGAGLDPQRPRRACSASRERQVRVIAPFVGGGFGPKIMMFYPEEVLVPWAAMRLERPVKWIEDRQENFFATTQERGQVHDAEMALDARRPHPRRAATSSCIDTGAYDPYGLTVPINSQCTLLGPYDVPSLRERASRAVFTNKHDRDALPRRRAAARRVRDGAAARHRRARARASTASRSGGATSFRPDAFPLQQRDHLPGLRAARLRQRQLRAGARQGAGR